MWTLEPGKVSWGLNPALHLPYHVYLNFVDYLRTYNIKLGIEEGGLRNTAVLYLNLGISYTTVCYFSSLYNTHKFFSEKAMAPHSSTLAWKIPWTEEPGALQSMGSQRVGHDWATSLSLFTFMHWRRKWQPTPVFLPGESQGQGSLVDCCLWGRTESDMTVAT